MAEPWQLLSNDPNAPIVQQARRDTLAKARAGAAIANREEYLASLVKGRDVLDVGVVAHTPQAYESPTWLHRHIAAAAKSCLGCDILESEVTLLRERGFNVVCRDICREPLDRTFEVIICGELIEHLDRPGALFESCAKMLAPGGRLALSTPNPWFVTYALKNLGPGAPLVDSVDHVAWYEPATLCELGARYGLRLTRFTGVRVTQTWSLRARLFFSLSGLLITCGMRPEAFAKTIIYEFEKA